MIYHFNHTNHFGYNFDKDLNFVKVKKCFDSPSTSLNMTRL
jgi:hypothetical protein